MRIAFLGPAGTFTEEALLADAPASAEPVPYATVFETVMAVQDGVVERAVVPIENSLEGSVNATLDALAGEAADVRIVAEAVRPIRHCLVAPAGLAIGDVERVLSHPQATAQCARFLRERIPGADPVAAVSTAEAVSIVATASAPWAAIGSRLAADLYGAEVLAEGIEDRPDNLTRFVWLARREAAERSPAAAPAKTSIVFWGFSDTAPGALVDVLGEFAGRGVNLTKIESRPRRVQLGHYMFFVDLDGGAADEPVAEALEALAGRVREVRLLGSYPAAR